MTTRIGFVHTVGFLVEEFRGRMRTRLPDIATFHILNESLLQDLLGGAAKALVYRRVVEQILLATDAKPDLIVVTCSSTSPAVDIARTLVAVPIVKIDDPMAAAAVRVGLRIGLLCTATSTVEPSSALLQAHAAQCGRTVSITPIVRSEAYTALMQGDRAQHDAIIQRAASQVGHDVDVLVLAQASLAHLQEALSAKLTCPVLASPALLMQDIEKRCLPR
jgi:Asp/Glu/hydantoin racemase